MMSLDKDTLEAIKDILNTRASVTIASLIFLYLIFQPIISPIQTIPGKLDILINQTQRTVEGIELMQERLIACLKEKSD